jgi:hypothetical protein
VVLRVRVRADPGPADRVAAQSVGSGRVRHHRHHSERVACPDQAVSVRRATLDDRRRPSRSAAGRPGTWPPAEEVRTDRPRVRSARRACAEVLRRVVRAAAIGAHRTSRA